MFNLDGWNKDSERLKVLELDRLSGTVALFHFTTSNSDFFGAKLKKIGSIESCYPP